MRRSSGTWTYRRLVIGTAAYGVLLISRRCVRGRRPRTGTGCSANAARETGTFGWIQLADGCAF